MSLETRQLSSSQLLHVSPRWTKGASKLCCRTRGPPSWRPGWCVAPATPSSSTTTCGRRWWWHHKTRTGSCTACFPTHGELVLAVTSASVFCHNPASCCSVCAGRQLPQKTKQTHIFCDDPVVCVSLWFENVTGNKEMKLIWFIWKFWAVISQQMSFLSLSASNDSRFIKGETPLLGSPATSLKRVFFIIDGFKLRVLPLACVAVDYLFTHLCLQGKNGDLCLLHSRYWPRLLHVQTEGLQQSTNREPPRHGKIFFLSKPLLKGFKKGENI